MYLTYALPNQLNTSAQTKNCVSLTLSNIQEMHTDHFNLVYIHMQHCLVSSFLFSLVLIQMQIVNLRLNTNETTEA